MFKKIFVENEVKDWGNTQKLIQHFPKAKVQFVDDIQQIFGVVKKPYLQKRENLNLLLGKKRGQKVKLAPEAYGLSGEPHYYFIHAYNCIYECEYCYLQGYFNSPDIVLFLNHDEIIQDMESQLQQHDGNVWFHAGEFSDSLALSHLTAELPTYWEFFKKNKRAKLELRTKSANIKELLQLEALENVFCSFSISSKKQIKNYDHKTAPYIARLKAMKALSEAGYQIGVHFDPVVYKENFLEDFRITIEELSNYVNLNKINYFSLGVVRFTKDVYKEVLQNYPNSDLIASDFVKSFDGKVRYNRPLRMHILKSLKNILLENNAKEESVYLCME